MSYPSASAIKAPHRVIEADRLLGSRPVEGTLDGASR